MTRFWLLLCLPTSAMALDLAPLWDFSRPAESEARFVAAMDGAGPDDRLILMTQVARTHGLRRDFDRGLAVLASMEPALAEAGAEARVRHALERGRCRVSPAHPPDTRTDAARALARDDYRHAAALAREARLDALAVDALHMLAVVDDAPDDALRWNRAALDVALSSDQPDARRWEAPLRNNLGLSLHAAGRLDEALAEFERAVVLRSQGANARATRVASWMVAWTLRGLRRHGEALAIQERLADEGDAAGQPDPYVHEELALLYEALGRPDEAEAARRRRQSLGS